MGSESENRLCWQSSTTTVIISPKILITPIFIILLFFIGCWTNGRFPAVRTGLFNCSGEQVMAIITRISGQLVAHLGQNMRFVLDTTVEDFLRLHARCRSREITPKEILKLVNEITPEPVTLGQSLNQLSGGQSRALMIGDIALVCDSPIVLIDEIENAGIDKQRALHLLRRQDKLVLVVTHDPHTALMSEKRIVLGGGAITTVVGRSPAEAALYQQLEAEYQTQRRYQTLLRKGELLA